MAITSLHLMGDVGRGLVAIDRHETPLHVDLPVSCLKWFFSENIQMHAESIEQRLLGVRELQAGFVANWSFKAWSERSRISAGEPAADIMSSLPSRL